MSGKNRQSTESKQGRKKIDHDNESEGSEAAYQHPPAQPIKLPSISLNKMKSELVENREVVPKMVISKNDIISDISRETKEKELLSRKLNGPLDPIKSPPNPKIITDDLIARDMHPERFARKSLEPVDRPVYSISVDINVTDKKSSSPKRMVPTPLTPPPVAIAPSQNGTIKVIYEMYHEEFEITEGTLLTSIIDEVYCLSDIMPSCRISLSEFSPQEMRDLTEDQRFVPVDGTGMFSGLKVGGVYYCYVKQDIEQLEREKAMRTALQGRQLLDNDHSGDSLAGGLVIDDGRGFDSCTCIYGTPCVVRL